MAYHGVWLVRARDPGGGREAERRHHGDPTTHHREAEHGDRPCRCEDRDHQAEEGDHGADPEHPHRAVPRHQGVAGEPHRAAGQQVGEDGERHQVGRGVEDLVEVLRSPGESRGVDHVEEHHRQADHDDRPPRHLHVAGGDDRLLCASQERREDHRQRQHCHHGGDRQGQVPGGQREDRAEHAAQRPGAVERRQDRPVVEVLEGDRLHVRGRVDGTECDAVDRHRGDEDRLVGCEREDRHGDRDPEQPGAQDDRAVDPLARGLCEHRPEAGEEHHHQEQQRQRGVAVVPVLLDGRQPGGEADEHEALGEERARGRSSLTGEDRQVEVGGRRHGPHRGTPPAVRP